MSVLWLLRGGILLSSSTGFLCSSLGEPMSQKHLQWNIDSLKNTPFLSDTSLCKFEQQPVTFSTEPSAVVFIITHLKG